MPNYRSKTTTYGRNMAGARALWRATGVKDDDFGKPIIAVANSFTQFVPGHVHLKDLGQMVCREIEKSGAIAKEFNTIAVDDGIAMGHDGMLYSLPSREIIADSVEYMVNAHCADAIVCISNCDKITPGMFNAALRLNIPVIFVSGGPMEAGKIDENDEKKLDLVDAMVIAASDADDNKVRQYEQNACPTCGSCSGMFTANSMNCLIEAIGLGLPGNGTLLATHSDRQELFLNAARKIVQITRQYYEQNDEGLLPRNIANKEAFKNAIALDVAMGGSTNTILHIIAAAKEAELDFDINDIADISDKVPYLCKLSPNSTKYYIEDFHRAGGVLGILAELDRQNLINSQVRTIYSDTLKQAIQKYDLVNQPSEKVIELYKAAPGRVPTQIPFSQSKRWQTLDTDRENGCIRNYENAYSKSGGLAVLYGNIAQNSCVIKTGGVDESMSNFTGEAFVCESQDDAVTAILNDQIKEGTVIVIRYEGPKGGPGMQEMLYPTSYLKAKKLNTSCALITDGRFSGGTSGLSIGHISPEAAAQGNIGIIENGDKININLRNKSINLLVDESIIQQRREQKNQQFKGKSWQPEKLRQRKVSNALKIYAHFVQSADQGAFRQIEE